jgi:tRNA uridine 5-carboxymethylaminomethyl modification enzyme
VWNYPKHYDVIVIGAGHAGCEAARCAALRGAKVLLLTMSLDTIAKMSCNPSIGGTAKGHIVREIDALGGFMGKAIDRTGIHFRMLNRSKGPAVWSPRAQADKVLYQTEVKQELEKTPRLDIKQGTIEDLQVEGGAFQSVLTKEGIRYRGKTCVLATGTFMRGLIHVGEEKTAGGRAGEKASSQLSSSLEKLGIRLSRLKTGTPARIHLDTIDLAACEAQPGEEDVQFSYFEKTPRLPQVHCYITYTSQKTRQIVLDNIERSPLYSGKIDSVGPRYCPSIEDKYMRFPDKERHQLFLEPEGLSTKEVYVNGISTCLPFDIQEALIHSVPGLEQAMIMRPGYAIEYDYALPGQINRSLETKSIKGLYFAGQINGTTGYEEAAGQGLIAGINASLSVEGKEPLILGRSESYIGVMIDDLIVQEHTEPYRMFTSRAEFRLLLRQDNADLRLSAYAEKLGLLSAQEHELFARKKEGIAKASELIRTLKKTIGKKTYTLEQLLARPESDITSFDALSAFSKDVLRQVDIHAKYRGYIERQEADIERLAKNEALSIPKTFNFDTVHGLRSEAREKLGRHRPESIAQAGRIAGVTPSDLHILMLAVR